MVYAAGGERSGNTVQLLDYTQTETWETSKYKYSNYCKVTSIRPVYYLIL